MVYFRVLVCCLYLMDEMLIRFSLVFDRWTTTPMPPSEPTDGSVVMGCTAPVFPPCYGTCCTALATRGFSHTVVVCIISSRWGAARSMWTFRLTPLTRLWWLGLPQLEVTTLMTLWRGLPTRPSRSYVSATCQSSVTPPLSCSPFRTRATQCGVSVWPPLATPCF
jgi:hypothetical protein